VTIHVSPPQRGDGISILESLAPYGDSPPLHIHHGEDEAFHVLDGELTVRVADELVTLAAGETILAPRGIPHTHRVSSRGGARWSITTPNGNFERFVRTLGRPADRPETPAPSGPPAPEQAAALTSAAREHGIDLIGPPLAAELELLTRARERWAPSPARQSSTFVLGSASSQIEHRLAARP
jgi:quercetin dioxygenase-like cupin family protein